MPRASKKKPAPPLTTAQRLGTIIKAARKIMRRDKGLSGDLDRLPMLTWIMFLKFLDDMELMREQAAALTPKEKFVPGIEAPYRWRDWAASPTGLTGPDLLAFITNEEIVLPASRNKKRIPGLFAYLRSLQPTKGAERREVIRNIFSRIQNRMESGYLLREVINKVNEIHFASSEEISVLGQLYESMLREMRDAAGDSGEFYTPRPVVRLMVELTDPRLGETVLDPAAGTGGFLVEVFNHLRPQVKTVQDGRALQRESIRAGEPKPLPYLLCQMNLLLHGLEAPQIDPLNSLRHKLGDISDSQRVDVIITNPPFGGEEEKSIVANFPADRRTAETALLFLQLIMRLLRKTPKPGRAAVVVPQGTLYGDGLCARIKEDLLKNFNLHTIIRLPDGVFAPYANIPTNILFFERGGPTSTIWYYEQPLPEGRRGYTKTQPIRFEEFTDCLAWWKKRKASERAWKVTAAEVLKYDAEGNLISCNLDVKNPHAPDSEHDRVPPGPIVARLLGREREFEKLLSSMNKVVPLEKPHDKRQQAAVQPVDGTTSRSGPGHDEESRTYLLARGWREVALGELLRLSIDPVEVLPNRDYPNLGIYCFGKGLFAKEPISGATTAATTLYRVKSGQFIYSRLFAFERAYGIVPAEFDGWYVSGEFPVFDLDLNALMPEFLHAYFRPARVWRRLLEGSKGLGSRRIRVHPEQVLAHRMFLPPFAEQKKIAEAVGRVQQLQAAATETQADLAALERSLLGAAFRGEL